MSQNHKDNKTTSVYRALIVLVFLVPFGFFSKHYVGPAKDWVNNSFGGLLYEVFWCVVGAVVFPRTHPLKIAFSVFTITCIIEMLQFFDWQILRFIRSFYIGQVLIGTTFVVSDFLYLKVGIVAVFVSCTACGS